ncbi:DEAD/DEAH box helicase [Marinobacteraceae bacterium S3BR75-40.1]
MTTGTITEFRQMALNPSLLRALDEVGYETPSPIQARTIPLLLEGRDVLGQAQTGTGKTAAFALPILSNLDMSQKTPQVLVLAPTRELAIQVSEAFQKYAAHMNGFHVLPIYGGQDFRSQLKALKRGVHVVVGTPGRVMDHMRRGTLKLDELKALVLDEADEMLRMGFIDDVEWVLEHTPPQRQIALFSATMPDQVRRIANSHLRNPAQVTIQVKTTTADTIRQRYWPVSGMHKLDALTRILEGETFDAMIIFVRTKTTTADLATKLEARGYAAAPLSGDVAQVQRERTVDRLKKGQLDIIVATDVAARGLDVERISHVINYDIPYDTEAYVHRIGRTGRAGRHGEAILFVTPRETRLLRAIEKATRNKIEKMDLPSTEWINDQRIARFKQQIGEVLASQDLELFTEIVAQYQRENDVDPLQLAAALAHMAQGATPLLLREVRPPRNEHSPERRKSAPRRNQAADEGLVRYRVEVGRNQGVKPGNLVGAIANEAGLDSKYIGRITLFDDFSHVDLPEGMPSSIQNQLKKVWVGGRQLDLSPVDGEAGEAMPPKRPSKRPAKGGKPKAPKPRRS